MPLHVDVRLNEKLLRRIHIARMSKGGLSPDSVNEYSVVVAEHTLRPAAGGHREVLQEEPTWLQLQEGLRITHRYGDSEVQLLAKAFAALAAAEASAKAE